MNGPLAGIERRVETISSYSDLESASALFLVPRNVKQLRAIFDVARQTGRRVTFRGGGHSFDGQSISDDFVVSMERFNQVRVLLKPGSARVLVGAGATWGEIVRELAPLGLVPMGTVTTAHATAGGTLSADCLSRFSHRFGKEGAHVVRFTMLTVDGRLHLCLPPRPGAAPATLGQRLFVAAIGGFGYLGAIIHIVYQVHDVGGTPIHVRTRLEVHRGFAGLAASLVPRARAAGPGSAVWASPYPRGPDDHAVVLFRSDFAVTTSRRPFFLFQPTNPLVIVGQWLVRVPLLAYLIITLALWLIDTETDYIDELRGFLFFMDAQRRSKDIAGRLGIPLPTIQQTFYLPWGDDPQGRLVKWLESAEALMTASQLTPTMQDVGCLPREPLPLLSASPDDEAFAVSYAFETSDPDTIARAQTVLRELSDVLWYQYGGRVSLVKNVCVRPATLADMYGHGAWDFFALKRRVDGACTLRNDFLERNFPDFMRLAGCTP